MTLTITEAIRRIGKLKAKKVLQKSKKVGKEEPTRRNRKFTKHELEAIVKCRYGSINRFDKFAHTLTYVAKLHRTCASTVDNITRNFRKRGMFLDMR